MIEFKNSTFVEAITNGNKSAIMMPVGNICPGDLLRFRGRVPRRGDYVTVEVTQCIGTYICRLDDAIHKDDLKALGFTSSAIALGAFNASNVIQITEGTQIFIVHFDVIDRVRT